MATQYERFRELTDETYDGCTDEQKLGVYVQHYPAAVVPFLLELLTKLDLVEEPDARTD